MNTTLEDRLVRAGRTLDEASAEYLRGASRRAVGVPGGPSAPDVAASGQGRRRLVVVVAAAAAVAIVGGGLILAVRGGADRDVGGVAAAVERTRSAPAMAVGVSEVIGTPEGHVLGPVELWHYGAPDRWEQLAPSGPSFGDRPPGGVSVRLYVGDRAWTVDGGRWVDERAGRASPPTPVTLMDTLTALDCRVVVDGVVVGWRQVDGVCEPVGSGGVPSLAAGTRVWTVETDADGRLRQVDAGTVLDLGPDVDVSGSTAVINRLGADAEVRSRFWYDGIPQVSTQPTE